MSTVTVASTSTSSYSNGKVTSSPLVPRGPIKTIVIKPSSSNSTSSKFKLFDRLPSALTSYIFSFDHSIPLPLCNRALHNEFTQLEFQLLKKFAPQLLGLEAKAVDLTPADLRKGINAAVLAQLKPKRTLFTRYEFEAKTGIPNPDILPFSLNPTLPLYHLIAYASLREKLLNMSKNRDELYGADHENTNFHLWNWPNILHLQLKKRNVVRSQLSNRSQEHRHPNEIAAALQTAELSVIPSLFRDNIDRLHDNNQYFRWTKAASFLSEFLKNPRVVNCLLIKDWEYALIQILSNELTFESRSSRPYSFQDSKDSDCKDWDCSTITNTLLANLLKTNPNLDLFKSHLQRLLKIKALEFQQQDFKRYMHDDASKNEHTASRIVKFGKHLRAFKKIISNNLHDFTFPVEFNAWAANPIKWRFPESTKCIVQ